MRFKTSSDIVYIKTVIIIDDQVNRKYCNFLGRVQFLDCEPFLPTSQKFCIKNKLNHNLNLIYTEANNLCVLLIIKPNSFEKEHISRVQKWKTLLSSSNMTMGMTKF